MRKLSYVISLVVTLVITACSGDDGFVSDPLIDIIDPGGAVEVSAVSVLASSPTMPSDPGQTLTVNAVVRDANNVATEGVTVIMSTDSGTLTVDDPVTNASGIVEATLSGGGDPTNRAITVSADANGVIGTVTVNVINTALAMSGPVSLPQGDTGTYTVVLTDAAGNGIGGETVDVTSATGNTLAATSLTTDASGQAQVDVTASAPGLDTITASALGQTATSDLNVSDDSFVVSVPGANAAGEITLNAVAAVEAIWAIGGVPQVGQTITFSSTRGTLSAFTANTNAAGMASVTISSTNAGPAVITATNSDGTSTSTQVEFVADTAATIDVQASPFTIGPGEQSAITAIVRDANNNLVKNEVVVFDLTDVTGGSLSVAQAVTDSQGRASTFYTASSTASANNGVVIAASVQANPVITNSAAITVAQRELFISLGTGNSIFEPNTAQYRVEFAIQISDSQGNGVEGVTVQAGILSNSYAKGFWFYDDVAGQWVQTITAAPCLDEDVNRNGVLDAGEDANLSGRIEAGNVATVVAQGGSGGTFTTGPGGFGIVDVIYAQEFARWVEVTLEATTSVQGTEFAKASNFILTINSEDVDDAGDDPPGSISPFGQSATCADTL